MITEITKEQEARMDEFRDKGIREGLETGKVSQEEIEKVCADVYRKLLDKEPVKVVVYDSPKAAWEAVKEHTKLPADSPYIHPYLDGHLFSYYFAFYDYMEQVLGVDLGPGKDAYESLRGILRMGNIYTLDDICIVSQRPLELHMQEGVLHNTKGPAIRYADGFAVYSIEGEPVEDDLLLDLLKAGGEIGAEQAAG